jgi:hypothetical protein
MTIEYVSQFVADPPIRQVGLELVTVTPERVEAVLQVERNSAHVRPCCMETVMALADTLKPLPPWPIWQRARQLLPSKANNFFAAIPVGDTAGLNARPASRPHHGVADRSHA